MSLFRIGQRVRITGCDPGDPSNIGKEAVVNELDSEAEDFSPGPWVGVTVDGDPDWVERPWHLAPIQPEGMQPVEWSECLWQPEGVIA